MKKALAVGGWTICIARTVNSTRTAQAVGMFCGLRRPVRNRPPNPRESVV